MSNSDGDPYVTHYVGRGVIQQFLLAVACTGRNSKHCFCFKSYHTLAARLKYFPGRGGCQRYVDGSRVCT